MIGGTKRIVVSLTERNTAIGLIEQNTAWYYDTLQKRAFVEGAQRAAIAAEFAMIQLWNPAASGKNLILTAITLSTNQVAGIELRYHNAVLDNPNISGNKYVGEAVPKGVVADRSAAVAVGTHHSFLGAHQAAVVYSLLFNEHPFFIIPGMGLHLHCMLVNNSMDAYFEWIEINV